MKRNRIYLQLGRAGDILNILPLLREDFVRNQGIKPHLMVGSRYVAILDGCSYLIPHAYAGTGFEDVNGAFNEAAAIAKANDLDLVPTQIYGSNIGTAQLSTSFMRDSWRKAPGAPPWGSLPLIFDRRDPTREQGVINQLRRKAALPYIVTSLSGESSPFPMAAEFLRYLRAQTQGEFEIIDVSGFTAPRFYDLLQLLEEAHALITIDSGVLHLAAAVPKLPVIAFITREPSEWHGSPWRPQHVRRFFYDEAPECFAAACVSAVLPERFRPMIYHVWNHHGPVEEETRRRIDFAATTWRAEYVRSGDRWIDCEFRACDVNRTSGDEPIKDPRPVAYMHDAINQVFGRDPAPDDIIAFTNADVSFCPGLSGWIFDIVSRHKAAFTHRYDFYEPLSRHLRGEEEVAKGEWYAGSDAFFFTVGWWRRHRREYPDMLIGREQNDEILRQLIKRTGGLEIRNSIYHEKHPSYWEHHGNREKNPGNLYNKALAKKWHLKTGLSPNDPWWWMIPSKTKG